MGLEGMTKAIEPTALRPMLAADVPVLAAIFQASIDELAEDDYDAGQRDAWASAADDLAAFGTRLKGGLTLVATIDGAPVGFVSLEGGDRLGLLYVHPAVARRGVGTTLYLAIEKLATSRGAASLTTASSDTAKPFFESHGFTSISRQTVSIGDEWLGNTRMSKPLR